MTVQTHALTVLEFARLLDHVAGHSSSTPGAARIRALRPVAVSGTVAERQGALERLRTEHERVSAVRTLLDGDATFRPEAIPELGDALARLRVSGTSWNGVELLGAITLLRSARRTQAALRDEDVPTSVRNVLAPFADRMIARKAIEERLERVLTEEGELRDDASPKLRAVRRELRGAEGDLVRLLERLMAKLEPHHRVDDASVTLRNGRYVIPVRREGRVAVGGIVHDSSQSGQTVFVEPPAAVEAGNRIRELEAEERAEVERLLLELTELLRPEREALLDAWDALVELDTLYGRARYAQAAACGDVSAHVDAADGVRLVAARDGFTICEGRHPLLLAQGATVVPFDLAMAPSERTLLVSGPNTGGKTVLLKALALIALMAQSGIPAPVAAGSVIPCFDDVFADIGDEQSLAASLSTFSAHLKHLKEIVERATPDSLVLVDELGSGTDPMEGAALGAAILEELTRRGTTTIATTHLGALKELAAPADAAVALPSGAVPGVVNASLQFDSERLAPTYRLVKGVPGRSYGLAIARRLAMAASVLENAEARVPRAERDLNALLADVEARSAALTDAERAVVLREDDVENKLARVTEREATVKAREKELERTARSEARRYVLDARAEVEKTIRDLKAAVAGADAPAFADLAAEARRRLEGLAAEQKDALEAAMRDEAGDGSPSFAARGERAGDVASDIEVGDAVEVGTLGGKLGQVIALRGDEAVAAVGALKLTVPMRALRKVSQRRLRSDTRGAGATVVSSGAGGDLPDLEAQTEVDVRGVRVHEVDQLVLGALDRAVRADLPVLRIIHGKGTGALRERVTQLLKKESRVKAYRLGAWNEGGAGVTVAELA